MKAFVIALILLALVLVFALLNMSYINACTGEMLDIAAAFPKTADDFDADYQATLEAAEHLWALWDKNIDRLALTVGYDSIDRIDEAMSELYRAAGNHDGEQFTTAALKFADSLRRLRELENFNAGSIF